MNQFQIIKQDIADFVKIYVKQDRNLKILDLVTVICLLLAFVNFLVLQIFNIAESAANAILIVFPIFVSGLTSAFRYKIGESKENTRKLLKQYLYYFIAITVPMLIAVVFFLI